VREWLWENTDPLIQLVAPSLASKSVLIGNETTPEKARKRHNASLCWTGKHEAEKIGAYIKWQGLSVLHGVYAHDMAISGVNNMGQFAPFRGLKSPLFTWDNFYLRPVKLVPSQMVEYKGIRMIRYLIDNSTWAVNGTLYNFIPGFANMTAANMGATVYLSNPHMLGANASWPSMISGFPQPDPSQDTTLVDVEPNSGTITHYDEGIQINIYLDPESSYFNLYNIDVRRGYMLPVVWTREFGALSDSDANTVKDNLYFAFALTDVIFWALLVVGASLQLLCIPALFVLLQCYRRGTPLAYRPVSLESDEEPFLREATPLDGLSTRYAS